MSAKMKWMGLLVGLSLLWAAGASAQAVKIGIMDEDKLRENYKELREALDKLEAEADAKQKEFDDLQVSLRDASRKLELRRDLNPDDATLKADERSLTENLQKLRGFMTDTNRELYRKRVEVLKPFVERIKAAVETVARENGYDLILKRGDVAYFSDKIDVTNLVLAELAKGGAVGSATSAPAGAGASARNPR